MANYSSNLKTWGATGSEYPDGYNYLEGEQPVDDWDNFIRYNAVEDVSHLINVTNGRIESGKGTALPTSPENAQLSYQTDEERLFHYDSTASSWHGLLKVDGDTLQGTLDVGSNTITSVGKLEMAGVADLAGNNLNDTVAGTTVYDATAGYVPLAILEATDVTLTAGSHLSGGGTISLGGSLSVSVDDDFLLNTGDTMSGELTSQGADGSRMVTAESTTSGDKLSLQANSTSGELELVGYDSSAATWRNGSALSYNPGTEDWTFGVTPDINGDLIASRVWVNNNADVPNADYADSAGDANTLDGNDSTAFSDSGHIHDGRYYTESEVDTKVQQVSDNGTVKAGNLSWLGPIHLADNETIEVSHATFLDQSIAAAADGVDLIVATDAASKATVLSGDGMTVYDDEAPATTYQNTSGAGETVVIGLDNGHYNAGSGAEQSLNATATYKTY